MKQTFSQPETTLCGVRLPDSENNAIKKPLMRAFALKDIDLGDVVIPAGDPVKIIGCLESSVYLAQLHGNIFAVSDWKDVRIYFEKSED